MSVIVYQSVVVVAAILLAASVFLALYRVIRGPSILDRMIATDVVLASIMCGLGGYMALTGRTDLLPVLIVLAMLGFVGSVSVSRYVSKSDSMTPGAEAGALSDFSASDWHVPKDDSSGSGGERAAWPDDVARGISNVPDGPVEVTVQDEPEVPVGDDGQGADPAANLPDESGEGHGAAPDSGPDDADDGAEEEFAAADDEPAGPRDARPDADAGGADTGGTDAGTRKGGDDGR